MASEQDTVRSPGEEDMDTTPTGASEALAPSGSDNVGEQRPPNPPRAPKPRLQGAREAFASRSGAGNTTEQIRSPPSALDGQLSPDPADRVFPVRSVISVEPTPSARPERSDTGYFGARGRRPSVSEAETMQRQRRASDDQSNTSRGGGDNTSLRQASVSPRQASSTGTTSPRASGQYNYINEIISERDTPSMSEKGDRDSASEQTEASRRPHSTRSRASIDDMGGLVTARFKHVVSEDGHAVITGRDGETLQRCEDEPIHIPGAVQGFGLLIAFEEQQESKLVVRVVSENSKRIIGYTPKQLFALESLTDILSEEQADNLLDHVDFIRDEDADVLTNGPEVFTMSIRSPQRKSQKLWCAMHINDANPNLVICEFELEDDPVNPLTPSNNQTPELPEDTLNSQPTQEEFDESTHNSSKPLRVLRSARKRKGEAAAMEVFNIMSQVQEQLAAAPSLDKFLKTLVGVIKELTGFHRVMIYQFDQNWNGRVVTELVDPRATRDLYKGLNFPASDIPKQARDLYKVNKVRMLYDRDQETARLVCRTTEDLETPLDLTHSYLRAMSPIHLKYLGNMAVRSSMSISINAFEELWGLIACHSYGSKGMRVSFPIRKMCRLVGDSASRNIERLSYASRLQARKLINTVPTQSNPSGYIVASSEDLLKLFDADFGLLSIRDETKILGRLEHSQEALAMLEYLRVRSIANVLTSMDIKQDFPDLRYTPGFKDIAGLLLVPLSAGGQDFIVFFRRGQLKEVKWAGNPYEKFVKEGTEGYLEPRKSFKTWSETIVGKCREWTEEEIETAAVLCLVYGKFIEVWRQKEAALQNSQLTKLLLANSAHEVRTPLNAIINYLEIALEGSLDQETRDNLAKSHSASKSLIYVINDLLDLTKTEEGGELVKGEVFDLKSTLTEATDNFMGDARRKNLKYNVNSGTGLPTNVIGDQRRVRQVISNVTANAIQNTTEGSVIVEMYLASRKEGKCEVEISVQDTGSGMTSKKLDQLFRELEQVQTEEGGGSLDQHMIADAKSLEASKKEGEGRVLGLGLALVSRIVRNMNGQMRLKSEEGKGSRFVIQFPFDLPDLEPSQQATKNNGSDQGSVTPPSSGKPLALPATPPAQRPSDEVMLIDRRSPSLERKGERMQMSRRTSNESVKSRRSMGSIRSGKSGLSFASANSGRSEADRLIDAIQEPHRVEGHQVYDRRPASRGSAGAIMSPKSATAPASRPRLDKRHHTTIGTDVSGSPVRRRSLDSAPDASPRELRLNTGNRPGESSVQDSGIPVRPVRVSEEFVPSSPATTSASAGGAMSSAASIKSLRSRAEQEDLPPPGPTDAEHMNVLVAEDDPVNSKIIKKRLEKLGHFVFLTVNGEECSSAYCERSGFFDIVLMDMQVSIRFALERTDNPQC